MAREGKPVLRQPRLDGAPKVIQQDLQNNSDHSWRVKADSCQGGGSAGADAACQFRCAIPPNCEPIGTPIARSGR